MSENNSISDGSAAILVYDKSINGDDLFCKWLRKSGFHSWGYHGWYDNCHWVYININNKIYAPGMPGISITDELGNHAVTIEEFKEIYNIYKKYEGKEVFVFHNMRFDCD